MMFSDTIKDYCGFETFHPKCWGKEVIVMDVALYGRMRVGRCIRESDAEELRDSIQIGCFTDVVSLVDGRCSGRQECEIRVPDLILQNATQCPLRTVAMYLEASYSCVEGKHAVIDSAILIHSSAYPFISDNKVHNYGGKPRIRPTYLK